MFVIRFLLFFVLIFNSGLGRAAEIDGEDINELSVRINIPNQVKSLADLLPLEFHFLETTNALTQLPSDFLLGPSATLRNEDSLERQLQLYSQRVVYVGGEMRRQQLWKLLEERANALSVLPPDPSDGVEGSRAQPYDPLMHSENGEPVNPVERFLNQEMGISKNDSQRLYRTLQVGYRMGGIAGAQMAWEDYLHEEARFRLTFLSGDVIEYIAIKKIELEDQLLGAFSSKTDPVKSTLDMILQVLRGERQHPMQDLFSIWLRDVQLDSLNAEELEQGLRDLLDKAFNENSSLKSIMQTPQDRYRAGIQAELNESHRHASGPKNKLSRVLDRIFDVIQYHLLLGYTWQQAVAHVDFVLRQPEVVMANRHQESLTDFVHRQTNSSKGSLQCRQVFGF
jgi:hypothetical protein